MKKNLFIYAALCALVVTGCSKQDEAETLQPEQGEALNVTISATRHEAPSTRTEYEDAADKLIVKWNSTKSDKLGVFTKDNGTTSNAAFSVTGDLSDGGKTAHFKGSLTVSIPSQETTVYGYYPYSDTAGSTAEAIPIDLSGQQQVGSSGKASLAHLAAKDYMAATPVTKKFSNGDQNLSLEFHPLLTIMSFKITKAMNVTSIKLEAAGTTHPTPFHTQGTVDITTADQTFPITPGGTTQSSVELEVTKGTIWSTGMFNMMIFPIAEEAMPAYFKATVTTENGDTYVQIKPAPEAFERGKRYIMELDALESTKWDGEATTAKPDATFSGGDGTQAKPYLIASAKDFSQFVANGEAHSSGKYFRLESDINLDNKTYYGQDNIGNPGTPSFSGNLDGEQHTISNLYIYKVTSGGDSYGLFATLSGTVTIANLHVQGRVETSTEFYSQTQVGGICGSIPSGSTIILSGCSFDGSVNGRIAGGICGLSKGALTIVACRNSGAITAGDYSGGIIGQIGEGTTANITACYNTGTVGGGTAGGIVGYGYNSTANVTACYNTCMGSTLYNIGSYITSQTACYAVTANASGDKTTLFSESAWPTATENPAWTAASDADGSENKYWKSLGSWNSSIPEYPKLWWEK